MLTKYNLKMPHAVFSGEDALEKICDIFAENHVKRLAVFSDKGIEGAGLLDFPMARVKASGVAYTVLDDLPAEPSYMEAQKLVDQCKEYGADFIMAVGGGSVQDTAKLASILMTDEYGIKELLDEQQLNGKCGLYAEVTLEPGCSLGFHMHYGESETYYILTGEGEYNDNGTSWRHVKAGDITFTPDGRGHGLANTGNTDLVFMALIIKD